MIGQTLALAWCLSTAPAGTCGEAPGAASVLDELRRQRAAIVLQASREWAAPPAGRPRPLVLPRLQAALPGGGDLEVVFAPRRGDAQHVVAGLVVDTLPVAVLEGRAPLRLQVRVRLPQATPAAALREVLAGRLGVPAVDERHGARAHLLWCGDCGGQSRASLQAKCRTFGFPLVRDAADCGTVAEATLTEDAAGAVTALVLIVDEHGLARQALHAQWTP